MIDWNPATVLVFSTFSLLIGLALLQLVRHQPAGPQRAWEDVVSTVQHSSGDVLAPEPRIEISTGEFLQVLRGDEGKGKTYFEPTMSFRVYLSNVGRGAATDIRGRVEEDGRSYWMTSGRVDLPEKTENREITLHPVLEPPVGPERINWLEMVLRLDYEDRRGDRWYTEAPLRLKIVRNNATDGFACWWVDVLEPQRQGRVATARSGVPALALAADGEEAEVAAAPEERSSLSPDAIGPLELDLVQENRAAQS